MSRLQQKHRKFTKWFITTLCTRFTSSERNVLWKHLPFILNYSTNARALEAPAGHRERFRISRKTPLASPEGYRSAYRQDIPNRKVMRKLSRTALVRLHLWNTTHVIYLRSKHNKSLCWVVVWKVCKPLQCVWFAFRNQNVQLLAGAWSYTRPSVVFTAATDGALYLWDILAQRINPTLCVQVPLLPHCCSWCIIFLNIFLRIPICRWVRLLSWVSILKSKARSWPSVAKMAVSPLSK